MVNFWLFPLRTISDIYCTELPKMVCTWLREVCSCSSLSVLPGPTWVLLSKIYKPFLGALYIKGLFLQFYSIDVCILGLTLQLPVGLMGVGGGWRGVDLIDAPPAMLFTDNDRPPRLSLFPLHNQILPHYAFS